MVVDEYNWFVGLGRGGGGLSRADNIRAVLIAEPRHTHAHTHTHIYTHSEQKKKPFQIHFKRVNQMHQGKITILISFFHNKLIKRSVVCFGLEETTMAIERKT